MSNGRGLPGAFSTNIAAPHVTSIVLVKMEFDGGDVYMTDCAHDVDWDGQTWLSLYGVGSVSDLVETDGEVRGLQFSISGVPASLISMALTEEIQGRPVTVYLATLASGTLSVDENAWSGLLDVMSLSRENGTATISVTAEHALARWDQPNLLRYSHEDQQRLHPGDLFFEYAAKMADATITWPAKEFFKK